MKKKRRFNKSSNLDLSNFSSFGANSFSCLKKNSEKLRKSSEKYQQGKILETIVTLWQVILTLTIDLLAKQLFLF